ncbi:porin [Marinobacter sp. G11]|uniref:porin n=1 Tax=Marinobacter sp. G11 TaxID=2903522 RepID=UPI001E39939F|nr:porin [Marinobacter sp. G11]MCE0758509.1 porin [Marinobacter sp. G11]
MKKHQLALFIAAAGLASTPAFAQKAEVSDLDVDFYGHINMAVMHADTGEGSEQYIVDNDYASSRVGARISTDLKDIDLKVGAHVEFEYQHNPSNLVTPDDRSIKGNWDERHINLFAAGRYGKISVGRGSGAADGATESDLSGTKVASFPDLALVGGAQKFIDKNDSGWNPTLFQSVRNQDFEARYDRVRYDAPAFGPVKLAVSQGYKDDQDITEVAATYNTAIDGLGRLSAAVGYSTKDVGGAAGDVENIGGSVSWLHDTGVNMTAVYSNVENDAGRDSDFNMFKVGYKTGKHSFTVHRAEGQDFDPKLERTETVAGEEVTVKYNVTGSDVEIYGVAYVYQPIKRLDVYFAYNNFALDADNGDYDDVNIAMIGSRLKF